MTKGIRNRSKCMNQFHSNANGAAWNPLLTHCSKNKIISKAKNSQMKRLKIKRVYECDECSDYNMNQWYRKK
ncbi:hypothetical protein QQG55_45900 [Brugia pahangi]